VKCWTKENAAEQQLRGVVAPEDLAFRETIEAVDSGSTLCATTLWEWTS